MRGHEAFTKSHAIIRAHEHKRSGWTSRESACGRYGLDVRQWDGGLVALKDGTPSGLVCLVCAKAVAKSVVRMLGSAK